MTPLSVDPHPALEGGPANYPVTMPHPEEQGDAQADMARIEAILAGMDAADLTLPEPPASVWSGIEAALAVDGPKVAPPGGVPVPQVVEYRIDAGDVVVEVGGAWADFATENGAPELATQPDDRTIWAAMAGDDVRDLWRLLVERVRSLQRGARVPFRCDGPDVRRWFEMTLTPEADGHVRFRSVLQFEEPRGTVGFLDHAATRDTAAEPVSVCSWCNRADVGTWLDIEEFLRRSRLLEAEVFPPIAYGICGSCRADMTTELLVPADTGDPSS